jgi:hypothetical protein
MEKVTNRRLTMGGMWGVRSLSERGPTTNGVGRRRMDSCIRFGFVVGRPDPGRALRVHEGAAGVAHDAALGVAALLAVGGE